MTDLRAELAGKTLLVTGPTSGIGREAALELARRGATVYLACRSEPAGQQLRAEIAAAGGAAHVLPLDLADLASVRSCAERFTAASERLDVLVNNAGVAGIRGETKDGFELAFGTNHLGHFLLTALLMPRLRASAPARVVVVASAAHYNARGIDLEAVRGRTRSLTGWEEYCVSKLANVLFVRELERRVGGSGAHAFAVHPGVVGTQLWRRLPSPIAAALRLFMKSERDGAKPTVYCATAPDLETRGGRYFDEDCSERKPSRPARDDELARRLWERSVEWTGADPAA